MVDPWGGSYFMESLTHSVAEEARKVLAEIEELGGMTKAIVTGMPKLRIEEVATRRQARIDRGEDTIVGVNKYILDEEPEIDVRDIDNTAVREVQVQRLVEIRARRKQADVDRELAALKQLAETGEGNLLDQAIVCAKLRASVGEISETLAEVYTRHRADVNSISGVYASMYQGDEDYENVCQQVAAFAETEGRRPRMLVVKLGQDGHDRGMKVISTAFADMGFDVDVGPLFQTPDEAARQAIDNDVHLVGVSSQAAGHKTLVPMLIDALREAGAGDILVIVGGVIPPRDYAFLREAGAAAIFGPGTAIPKAVLEVLGVLRNRSQ